MPEPKNWNSDELPVFTRSSTAVSADRWDSCTTAIMPLESTRRYVLSSVALAGCAAHTAAAAAIRAHATYRLMREPDGIERAARLPDQLNQKRRAAVFLIKFLVSAGTGFTLFSTFALARFFVMFSGF